MSILRRKNDILLLFVMLSASLLLSCRESDNSTTVNLDPAERQWLDSHREDLYFAPDPFYAPFEFYDGKDGIVKGLAHDYINLIEKKLGIQFKCVRASSFSEILSFARQQKVAIVNAVTETPERGQYLLFTEPIVEIMNVIIVRKSEKKDISIKDLEGKKVSVVKEYAITEHLAGKYPGITSDIVPTDLNAILNVAYGVSDAAIIDLAAASYFIEKEGLTNLRVAGDARYPVKLAIGSRKDWPELNGILRKGLASITHNERKAIYNKWITLEKESLIRRGKFLRAAVSFIALLLTALAVILLWNKQLKRKIHLRTSDLKNALDDLQTSEERFRRLAENAKDMIYLMSLPDGKYQYVSPALLDITGYTPEECYANALLIKKRIHPDWNDYFARQWQNILAGKVEPSYEYKIIHKSGEERWLNQRNVLIRDEHGRPAAIEGIVTDITVHKRAEEEKQKYEAKLQQSYKMEAIGTLAGGIAHDFNNILAAILGYTDYAKLMLAEGKRVDNELDQIMKSSLRARDLVRQILTFSRRAEIQKKTIEVDSVIKEAARFMRASLPATIEISLDLEASNKVLMADPVQLHQVLMNLCTNAAYAMRAQGGTLAIGLSNVKVNKENNGDSGDLAPGNYLQISVSDTGSGIPGEVLGRIFEPFFTTKAPGDGTGMGLSVVHGIVKDMGGAIYVHRTEQGKGTTFHVLLPSYYGEAIASEIPRSMMKRGDARILLVDDEEAVIESMSKILKHLGYTIVPAVNSSDALQLFKSGPASFDLVITDNDHAQNDRNGAG